MFGLLVFAQTEAHAGQKMLCDLELEVKSASLTGIQPSILLETETCFYFCFLFGNQSIPANSKYRIKLGV